MAARVVTISPGGITETQCTLQIAKWWWIPLPGLQRINLNRCLALGSIGKVTRNKKTTSRWTGIGTMESNATSPAKWVVLGDADCRLSTTTRGVSSVGCCLSHHA